MEEDETSGEQKQQAKPTFDDVARAMGEGVERALAAGDANAALPPQQPPPQGQEPPAPAPAQGQEPPAPAPAQDQRFVSVDAFQPMFQQMQQMTQAVWQQNQMLMQWQRQQQPQQPQPERPQPPRAEDLARSFIPPARQPGEDDLTYQGRSQAAMMDHLYNGQREYILREAESLAERQVNAYRQQVEAARLQQEGVRQFNAAVEGAVRSAGLDPSTEAGAYVRDQVRANIVARAAMGETAGWGVQDFQRSMAQDVARVKARTIVTPPPGTAPQLSVVTTQPPPQPTAQNQGARPGERPAPVGGAGGGGAPAVPPSARPAPLSREEARKPGAFERVFEGIQNGVYQAMGKR